MNILPASTWRSRAAAACLIAVAAVLSLAPSQPPATWRIVADWPRPSDRAPFGEVSGVSVDSRGHVFVFHRAGRGFNRDAADPITGPTVRELDPDTGATIAAWGAGMFLIPHSITVDRQDNVWLTDVGRHQVFKFSHDGRLLLELGQRRIPGWDSTHFNEPTDVAVAPDGTVFVSDGYKNARVAHFSAEGRFLNEWGSHGTAPGQFDVPHGLAIDAAGRVYVADRQNSRVQVFDPSGALLRVWPQSVSKGRVFALAVDPSGAMYVARKDGAEAIQFFDAEFGDAGMLPARIGRLVTPHAIAVYDRRVIYVADTTGQQLRKFIRQ